MSDEAEVETVRGIFACEQGKALRVVLEPDELVVLVLSEVLGERDLAGFSEETVSNGVRDLPELGEDQGLEGLGAEVSWDSWGASVFFLELYEGVRDVGGFRLWGGLGGGVSLECCGLGRGASLHVFFLTSSFGTSALSLLQMWQF